MFSRVARYRIPEERLEEGIEAFRTAAEELSQLEGTTGGYLLVDRDNCTAITVTLAKDYTVTVSDNGRGIPVDINQQTGLPGVEMVMTKLHAGGKFDTNAYKVSGGLHGVGVSCVNFLSEWLKLEIWRDGLTYE